MTVLIIIQFVLISVLAAGLFLLWLKARKKINSVKSRLEDLEKRLSTQEKALPEEGGGVPAGCTGSKGGSRLDPSSLKSRLEKADSFESGVSEKYGYVGQMARSGLGPGEIADILEVSKEEASQMLSIARSAEGC